MSSCWFWQMNRNLYCEHSFRTITWKLITVRAEISQLIKHFFPLGKCSQLSFGHWSYMSIKKRPITIIMNTSSMLEEIWLGIKKPQAKNTYIASISEETADLECLTVHTLRGQLFKSCWVCINSSLPDVSITAWFFIFFFSFLSVPVLVTIRNEQGKSGRQGCLWD